MIIGFGLGLYVLTGLNIIMAINVIKSEIAYQRSGDEYETAAAAAAYQNEKCQRRLKFSKKYLKRRL